jgi:hypothetical protein
VSAARQRPRTAARLTARHDGLLFDAAFPRSRAAHRAARAELERIETQARQLSAAQRALLDDSGVAGTQTTHTFMYGVARWLAERGERIRFAWDRDLDAEGLDPLLQLWLTSAESDRFESGEVSTREWLAEASGGDANAARWLLAAAPSAATDAGRTWRALYDGAPVPLRWELTGSRYSASRAHVRVPVVPRRSFRKLPADPRTLIATPLHGITRLRAAEATRWHDAALAALASRTREVFATVYADLQQVYLAPLGEGTAVCLFGASHADRSAVEANFGYVLFSNGVPIGYGGVTALGAQANTGANLFASFRHSEAAFLFAQALRAFRTLLGVSRFVVNPYQLGAGNDEAIASGAYWFYDRLGFRPVQRRLARLADRERAAIAQDHTHRSSLRTLRALSAGDAVLELPEAARTALIPERRLLTVGAAASRALATVPAGARAQWIDHTARVILRRCTGAKRPLTVAEQRGARHLIPVLAPFMARIARWTPADRRALWQLVVLKGHAQEAGFARAAARLPPLHTLLRSVSRAAPRSRPRSRP